MRGQESLSEIGVKGKGQTRSEGPFESGKDISNVRKGRQQ